MFNISNTIHGEGKTHRLFKTCMTVNLSTTIDIHIERRHRLICHADKQTHTHTRWGENELVLHREMSNILTEKLMLVYLFKVSIFTCFCRKVWLWMFFSSKIQYSVLNQKMLKLGDSFQVIQIRIIFTETITPHTFFQFEWKIMADKIATNSIIDDNNWIDLFEMVELVRWYQPNYSISHLNIRAYEKTNCTITAEHTE